MNTDTINSITDLTKVVEFRKNSYPEKRYFKHGCEGPPWYKYNHNLWFRGQGNFDWGLQPQVERPKFIEVAKNALEMAFSFETSILNQFNIQSSHLIPRNLSLTDKYFLAQHFGFPTRLLDWTTNPLVALFFAISTEPENDGSLYCFYSRGDISFHEEDDIINQNSKSVTDLIEKLFKRSIEFQETKKSYPLRIIPNSQEGRINRQESRFTLHYPGGYELEQQLGNIIFKYKIPAKTKKQLAQDLRLLGVNWATLFPDLDHLVKDLKTQINFS